MRRAVVLLFAAIVAIAGIWWLRSRSEAPATDLSPPTPSLDASAPPDVAPEPLPDSGVGSLPASPRRAKTATAAAHPRFSEGVTSLKAAWGGKPGQLGRKRDPETNPEAPMAILATGKDDYFIVDQVNQRVQRFRDGAPVAEFRASETVQDIATGPEGKTILMDRLADKTVQVFDADGKLVNEAPIVGKGISEGGKATGVFADDQGIYVERDHGPLVRIADARGNQDPSRPELPGRPTKDGRLVVAAAITEAQAGRLVVTAFDRKSFEPRWSTPIALPRPILHLLMLDSDRAGNVYVAADTANEGSEEPYALLDEAIVVVRLGPEGAITGTLELAAHPTGDEMQRPLSIGDDGAVYQMVPRADGVTVMRFSFR